MTKETKHETSERIEVSEPLAVRVLEELASDWRKMQPIMESFLDEIELASVTPGLREQVDPIAEEVRPLYEAVTLTMKSIAAAAASFTREELVEALRQVLELKAAHERCVGVLQAAREAATKGSA